MPAGRKSQCLETGRPQALSSQWWEHPWQINLIFLASYWKLESKLLNIVGTWLVPIPDTSLSISSYSNLWLCLFFSQAKILSWQLLPLRELVNNIFFSLENWPGQVNLCYLCRPGYKMLASLCPFEWLQLEVHRLFSNNCTQIQIRLDKDDSRHFSLIQTLVIVL